MPSSVPHLLLNEDGTEIRVAEFGPAVFWEPGDRIVLGADATYRVLERREASDGLPVTLVLERVKPARH